MNITIVGGGNIGTLLAVHCAHKQHDVTLFCSRPKEIKTILKIVDKDDNIILSGRIKHATSCPEEAFSKADMILITYPAFMIEKISELITPYARKDMYIGLIPGTGGGEFSFRNCISKGAVLFGLQRVPCIARIVLYGETVRAKGYKNEIYIAALPEKKSKECELLFSDLLGIQTISLPNYLCITMTPSNPILHTTRLYSIFKDYAPNRIYDALPLFYEDWDDESSELLLLCDDEVQRICKAFKEFDLRFVRSLREHYESDTPVEMTKKISGIEAFKGIETPYIRKGEGFAPDFSSRYFTADFSYGLSILVQIGDMLGVNIPYMKKVLMWYEDYSMNSKSFSFSDYGIKGRKDLIDFYASRNDGS